MRSAHTTSRCWRTGSATEWNKETYNVVALMVHAAARAALLAAIAGPAAAQGIYTCVDAKGRRITADRPIIDCIDREQTELGTNGLPRRRIAPTPTAAERAAQEDKARQLAEERSRALEEAKRQRALLTRYPDAAAHDKERAAVLARLDSIKAGAQQRIAALQKERQSVEAELEFYRSAPARTPPKLRHQLEHVDQQLAAQKHSQAEQDAEKLRVDARFDQEQSRLKHLWAQQTAVPPVRAGAINPPASSSAVR